MYIPIGTRCVSLNLQFMRHEQIDHPKTFPLDFSAYTFPNIKTSVESARTHVKRLPNGK